MEGGHTPAVVKRRILGPRFFAAVAVSLLPWAQIILPAIHGEGATAGHARAIARDASSAPSVRDGSGGPVHDPASCALCQAIHAARGSTTVAPASLPPRGFHGARPVLAVRSVPPRAPDLTSASPRGPPASPVA